MKYLTLLGSLLIVVILNACSADPVTVEVTRIVSEIAEVEVTRLVQVEVTAAIEVTREVAVTWVVERLVTATKTATPLNSPTPSNTPTSTNTPTPTNTPTIPPTPTITSTPTPSPTASSTPNVAQTATVEAYGVLASPKRNGIFTVGIEILPGKWHSTGTQRDCYWARLDANQDINDNHFGLAGGTVFIRESDYEIVFEDCGTWEFVENADQILLVDATEQKGDGFYTVNVEIAPGRWQSTDSGDACYWSRLTGTQDILDNHFGLAGGTVTVRSTDYEIVFDDCGMWEYLGSQLLIMDCYICAG